MWMQLAGLGLSVIQGFGNAKDNNKMSKANRDNAVMAQTYDNRAINARLRQSEDVSAGEKRAVRLAALETNSAMKAQGKNIGGTTHQRLLQKPFNIAAAQIQNANYNERGERMQAISEKKGTTAAAQSRINSMPIKKYNPMGDILNAGLSIAGNRAQLNTARAGAGLDSLSWGDYFKQSF